MHRSRNTYVVHDVTYISYKPTLPQFKKGFFLDFLGGPVGKTLCSQSRGPGVRSLVRELDPACHNQRVHVLHLKSGTAKQINSKIYIYFFKDTRRLLAFFLNLRGNKGKKIKSMRRVQEPPLTENSCLSALFKKNLF